MKVQVFECEDVNITRGGYGRGRGNWQRKPKGVNMTHQYQGNKQTAIKGELQRQNKLLSAKRPFGVLHNETKIVKIRQAVLEIFNFKDLDLDSFTRKND